MKGKRKEILTVIILVYKKFGERTSRRNERKRKKQKGRHFKIDGSETGADGKKC